MNQNDLNAIAALDLEPIKVKLMHKESGEGWSLDQANAVEFEYRRFLILMKQFPNEQTAPLMDVDTFWHYHILDTMKYAADCEAVFGYFLHHFPYIGLRGAADLDAHAQVGARMQQLYEATFGEPYLRAAPAGTAYSGASTGSAAYSGASTGLAYSGASTRTAYSGASTGSARAANTAYSGASTDTAYSGASTGIAYSGASTGPAYSGATARTAYSGASTGPAQLANSAYSGAPAGATAYSGASQSAGARLPDLYASRPRLSQAA